MTRTMQVSEVRANLPDAIESLGSAGPITLIRYGNPVAVLGLPDPRQTRWLFGEHLTYINALFQWARDVSDSLTPMDVFRSVERHGIGTPRLIGDLLAEIHRYETEYGTSVSSWSLTDVPDGAIAGDVRKLVAYLFLGSAAPQVVAAGQGDEITRWANEVAAAVTLREDGDRSTFDHEENLTVFLAAGYTPEAFTVKAVELTGQGVPLEDLSEAIGDAAIPPDVLAIDGSVTWWVENLTSEPGALPADEVYALVRKFRSLTGKHSKTIKNFAEAGADSATQVIELMDAGINSGLALRAARDGYTVEQWLEAVPAAQRYSYGDTGLLPFQVLAEGAQAAKSLTAWDKNVHITKARAAPYAARPAMESSPWRDIYPDRVLDLANAGVSPGFAAECANLFGETTADLLIALRAAGLTLPIVKAMRRTVKGKERFQPTHGQVLRMLELGLTEAATLDLMELSSDPLGWVSLLKTWRDARPAVQEFIATLSPREWRVLTELKALLPKMRDAYEWRSFGNPLAEEGLGLLDVPERLHYGHLKRIDFMARSILANQTMNRLFAEFADGAGKDAIMLFANEMTKLPVPPRSKSS